MLRKEALVSCKVADATPSANGDMRIRFVYTPAGWRCAPPKASPSA